MKYHIYLCIVYNYLFAGWFPICLLVQWLENKKKLFLVLLELQNINLESLVLHVFIAGKEWK